MAIQFYEIEKKKIIMVVLDNNMLIFAEDTWTSIYPDLLFIFYISILYY